MNLRNFPKIPLLALGVSFAFLACTATTSSGTYDDSVELEPSSSGAAVTLDSANLNANSGASVYAANLEMPHFEESDTLVFLPHTVTLDSEILNYAIFYNGGLKHAEWVAFSFDEATAQDNVTRSEAWAVDPLLDAEFRTDNSYHTYDGFDRGHLCASEDRVFSEEANEQTFYYSNVSPQLNDLNANFWNALEALVRGWGRSVGETFDKVYVAKGGTLNELLKAFKGEIADANGVYPETDAEGFTSKGLPCPKYYFMAVLAESGGEFNAIGFLVEHKEGWPESPTAAELQATAMSIDALETATGLDFFCNLDDETEAKVEATLDLSSWAW